MQAKDHDPCDPMSRQECQKCKRTSWFNARCVAQCNDRTRCKRRALSKDDMKLQFGSFPRLCMQHLKPLISPPKKNENAKKYVRSSRLPWRFWRIGMKLADDPCNFKSLGSCGQCTDKVQSKKTSKNKRQCGAKCVTTNERCKRLVTVPPPSKQKKRLVTVPLPSKQKNDPVFCMQHQPKKKKYVP